MKKARAIQWARSQKALACRLGISVQAVNKWPEIVPFHRAIQLEQISAGKLKVNHGDYVRRLHSPAEVR